MKSAGGLQDLKTRTEIKMVCVAQDDFSLDILLKVSMIYSLDRAHCADRHEDRSLDLAMVSRNHSASCCRIRIVMRLYEFHLKQFNRQR